MIARSEWIEWWDCGVHENGLKGPRAPGDNLRPLPFKRLGCSWGCVPGQGSAQGEPDKARSVDGGWTLS